LSGCYQQDESLFAAEVLVNKCLGLRRGSLRVDLPSVEQRSEGADADDRQNEKGQRGPNQDEAVMAGGETPKRVQHGESPWPSAELMMRLK
jgi:hypothetical protein